MPRYLQTSLKCLHSDAENGSGSFDKSLFPHIQLNATYTIFASDGNPMATCNKLSEEEFNLNY